MVTQHARRILLPTLVRSRPMRRGALGTCVALLLAAVVLPACSSGDDSASTANGVEPVGGAEVVRGGDLTYALEAETSGGWCIPEAQLAISGMMVAWTVYDFLFVPSADDGFVPFLAESLERNDEATEFVLHLREGVTFHDGSPLDAEVVRNNIDAWRGEYPARKALLGPFVLANIDSVEVVDDMSVRITTKVPWPALPAYLYGGARNGVMAQAQLDDPDTCDRALIGTGPFEIDEWEVNDHLRVVRNDDYWRDAPDGEALPYLDSITFRPVPDAQARVNGLLSGEYDMMMTSAAPATETLDAEARSGNIALYQTSFNTEVGFIMFNESQPPFDSPTARRAVATALDRESYNEVVSLGLFEVASGPFAPGAPGYLEDAGFPAFDLDAARELVQQYERESGSPLEFTYVHGNDEDNTRSAQFLQEMLEAAGMTVNLRSTEQATQINTALGDDWQAMAFRNFPSGVPDGNYVWWYTGSPVNFGRIADSEVDRLLDEGRSELDEDVAEGIYEDLNRRLSDQVHFAWLDWTTWSVGMQPDTSGVLGPPLPDDQEPSPGLATGHATAGIHFTE
ncbi:MAG: ABC transporter substrate-binding protein [Microthrixaceae bacterium]|nr:ABC transporter substrate-binding protein [Microthrixaceae bacterium]